jgi:hypothetical protein
MSGWLRSAGLAVGNFADRLKVEQLAGLALPAIRVSH